MSTRLLSPSRDFEQDEKDEYTAQPIIRLQSNQYLVEYGDRVHSRLHYVGKDKKCSCGDSDCPAIDAVRQYLLAGGARAPDPPDEYRCPICGSSTTLDPDWNGKYTHEIGWRCDTGGLMHFLLAKARRIQQQVAENPYLIPPAPGYPGLLRVDLVVPSEMVESQILTPDTSDMFTI